MGYDVGMCLKIGTAIRVLVVLVFALICVMAVLQPQGWLFLFRKSFVGYVVMIVLFLVYGIARKL